MKRPRELLAAITIVILIVWLAPILALGQTPTPGPLLGNIKGVVFNDLNRNGSLDEGEPPIGDVPLRIESGDWNYSTSSAADGTYEFCCLTKSTYYITASPPAGYANTTVLPLAIAVDGTFWTNQNIGLATAAAPTPGPYERVTNTSGRPQPVLDGVTGQPVYIGATPWQIAPGEAFFSYRWGDSSRFVWQGKSYHYIGSVAGSTIRFFLVEE